MRLPAAGMAILLLAVLASPPAAGAKSSCRVSLSEPTQPAWSEDCVSVPDVTADQSASVTTQAPFVNNSTMPGTSLCSWDNATCNQTVTVHIESTLALDSRTPLELRAQAWMVAEDQQVDLGIPDTNKWCDSDVVLPDAYPRDHPCGQSH